jgi:hypothetical protein
MTYPDYGTPGNPNMDPYYISPEEEKRIEADEREKEANLRDALIACVSDNRDNLWRCTVAGIVARVLLEIKPCAGESDWLNRKVDAAIAEILK